jgi:2-methylcitrate dehydratase PrpD
VATPVEISPTAPGQLRARIIIKTNDGRRWESVLEHHRGSVENPLARADVEAKFEANTGHILSREQRRALRGTTGDLAALPSVARLLDNCIRGRLD